MKFLRIIASIGILSLSILSPVLTKEDVSFEDFLGELLKEIEKEAQQMEKKGIKPMPFGQPPGPKTPKMPSKISPAPMSTRPTSQMMTDDKPVDMATNFLRPCISKHPTGLKPGEKPPAPKLPAFKEEALQKFVNELIIELRRINKKIASFDVYERQKFTPHLSTIDEVETLIGQIISKKLYHRALFDISFNLLRSMIIDYGAHLEKLNNDYELQAMQPEEDELFPSETMGRRQAIKNIRAMVSRELPMLVQELKKVPDFAKKSVEEKKAAREKMITEAEARLKQMERKTSWPYQFHRPSYSQPYGRQQQYQPSYRYGGYTPTQQYAGRPSSFGSARPTTQPKAKEDKKTKKPSKITKAKDKKDKDKDDDEKKEEKKKDTKDGLWLDIRDSWWRLTVIIDKVSRLRENIPNKRFHETALELIDSQQEITKIEKYINDLQKKVHSAILKDMPPGARIVTKKVPAPEEVRKAPKQEREHIQWLEDQFKKLENSLTQGHKKLEKLHKDSMEERMVKLEDVKRRLRDANSLVDGLLLELDILIATQIETLSTELETFKRRQEESTEESLSTSQVDYIGQVKDEIEGRKKYFDDKKAKEEKRLEKEKKEKRKKFYGSIKPAHL